MSFHLFSKKDSEIPEVKIPFDPARQRPVIRASICTGEKVAGFRDLQGGHFTEVMVIREPADLRKFEKMYGVSDVKTEY